MDWNAIASLSSAMISLGALTFSLVTFKRQERLVKRSYYTVIFEQMKLVHHIKTEKPSAGHVKNALDFITLCANAYEYELVERSMLRRACIKELQAVTEELAQCTEVPGYDASGPQLVRAECPGHAQAMIADICGPKYARNLYQAALNKPEV